MSKQLAFALITTMSLLASGCDREGPAEQAGEALDDAAREMEDVGEDMGHQLEDAGEEFGNQLEDACEEIKGEMNASNTDC